MSMTKAEMVTQISEKTGLTKKDASTFLDAFLETVEESLAKGEKVQIVGFGSFMVRERPAREGRSPATGEKIQIPASKAPVFKAGKSLKDNVNS